LILRESEGNPNVNVESLFTLEQKIRSYDEALYFGLYFG